MAIYDAPDFGDRALEELDRLLDGNELAYDEYMYFEYEDVITSYSIHYTKLYDVAAADNIQLG